RGDDRRCTRSCPRTIAWAAAPSGPSPQKATRLPAPRRCFETDRSLRFRLAKGQYGPVPFATTRGGTDADFGRQAPRPPADFGRHRSLHDDRDGPAGEPPEDVASGGPEGRDLCGDGGRQAGGDERPGSPRERLPPRPRVRRRAGDQSVCSAGADGPARFDGDLRVRKERQLAAHDAPRRLVGGEGEAARRERRKAPDLLQPDRKSVV